MLNEDTFTVNPLSFNICKAYLQSIWLKIHSRAPDTSKTLNLQSGAQAVRARSRDCTFLSFAFEAVYLDPICFLNLLIIIILCIFYPISFILISSDNRLFFALTFSILWLFPPSSFSKVQFLLPLIASLPTWQWAIWVPVSPPTYTPQETPIPQGIRVLLWHCMLEKRFRNYLLLSNDDLGTRGLVFTVLWTFKKCRHHGSQYGEIP